MIDIEQYLQKQIILWKIGGRPEKGRKQNNVKKADRASFGPYILISREMGAGGTAVAKLVGEKLGWSVFDREIVDEIAQKTNVRNQLIENLDEQERGLIENMIVSMLDRKNIDESRYMYQLREVILTLGKRGRVVIVGRGANFILPGKFGLSVRLIAPQNVRAQRTAEEFKLDLKRAINNVKKSDRERTKYVHHQFKHDINDPFLHDLIVNTVSINMNAVAETILAAAGQKLGINIPKAVNHK